MLKHYLAGLLSALSLMLTACATTKPDATIAISVQPFYNSTGPVIQVGDLSAELATDDPQSLLQTSKKMQSNIAHLRPEHMYVAAVRLFELGEADTSLYWFYQAQYRSRLYNCTIDKEHTDNKAIDSPAAILARTYRYFYIKTEPFFSKHAQCNLDQWQSTMSKVEQENTVLPALESLFPNTPLKSDGFQQCNEKVARQLRALTRYIEREIAQKDTNTADNNKYTHCS